MFSDLRNAWAQDRNGDGIIDYINARIYVEDNPTPTELAAAANIAARLAFETTSMDLPVGFQASMYRQGPELAVAVGRAAKGITAPLLVALPDPQTAAKLVQAACIEDYTPTDPPKPKLSATNRKSLASLFTSQSLFQSSDNEFIPEFTEATLILGPSVRSTAVIDLAARIGLESATLRLPIATVAPRRTSSAPPRNSILVGRTNPYVQQLIRAGKFPAHLPPGAGRIEIVDSVVVIAGADPAGEQEALRYAAMRLPYLREYGKGQVSLAAIEDQVRRYSFAKPEHPVVVFDDAFELPWELDAARRLVEGAVLQKIRRGSGVTLELRLSEPLSVRQSLAAELLEKLKASGSDPTKTAVRILCAHKQGYCWMDEELKPQLRALNNAAVIRIFYRALTVHEGSVDSASRWLEELYPIDEVLSRDLGIPLDSIAFHKAPPGSAHIYEVVAEDAEGRNLWSSTFDPYVTIRPLFDIFPDYASATVATGLLRATIDGERVVDQRIETDYERFWNLYQSKTLPQIRDYILKLYGGTPREECAPHFAELTIDLELSEPDFQIGVDQERISTLEALHEDIYFETLLFFDVLGTSTCGKPLRYPGRIIPVVRPSREGPGRMRARLLGYAAPTAADRPFDGTDPQVQAVNVLRGEGVYAVEVSTDVRFSWLLSERHELPPIEARAPAAPASSIVQWDQPIGPEECEGIIGRLSRFPEVRPYLAGRSYLGRPVWAMDVTSPHHGKYFSQAKACIGKPCLFVTGRQHANEVSSTSHILRFVELLATDATHRKLLQRVNFVVHPIANPDGAALVDELHRISPDFMLHAGYLGSLGVDITDRQWTDAPKYPEARVRTDLWRMWLPDIVLNPHGYPSHEWIQLFAGYTAWVRSKGAMARDWWIPRGWFIPRFDYIEDATSPNRREEAIELRGKIAREVSILLGNLNERMYRRYAKYSGAELPLTDRVLIYFSASGIKPDPKSESFMTRHPEITFMEMLSEAPDEVATGEWLKTLAGAGLAVTLAHAQLLAEWPHTVKRTTWTEGGRRIFRVSRKRRHAV